MSGMQGLSDIDAINEMIATTVAAMTGKRKVLFFVSATQRLREKVVEGKERSAGFFR
nr:hypothetical protein [Candidatus Viridilinea mediisalina]